MEEKRENKALIVSYSRALGYDKGEVKCLLTLWARESRFDHFARPRDSQGKPISSAFGIAQLLRERSGEPELQILHGYDTLVTATEGVRVALSHIATDEAGTDV
jgi:hypothetical protein